MAYLVKAYVTLAVLVATSVAQQWRADLRLGDLARFTSTLESNLGNLADRIEEEVQNSLPRWMRNRGREDSVDRHHASPLSVDEGIEAISGIIGDGIDDGLKVHMDGDTDGKVVGGAPDRACPNPKSKPSSPPCPDP
nr:uncharacterized protein LOC113813558 [Penaeus vannamei]